MATRKQQAQSPEWLQERVRTNVRLLKSLRQLSDADIAAAAGFSSRQVISHRLSGRTDLTVEDFARLAAALGVEPYVLMLTVGETVQWVEEHETFQPPVYTPQAGMPTKARKPAKKPAAKRKAAATPAAARTKTTRRSSARPATA